MAGNLVVGVLGGTGFAGGELCRLLLNHPNVSKIIPYSRSDDDFEIVHQNLWGCGLEFQSFDAVTDNIDKFDVVFLCTPAGVAMQMSPEFIDKNVTVIDLSPDFRFADAQLYEQVYEREHSCPHLLEKAVYGVSEFNRKEIQHAEIIANPGCYVITALLAIKPMIEDNWITFDQPVTVSAINGTSGAGKSAKLALMHAGVHGNMMPYSLNGHRHGPELENQLSNMAQTNVRVQLSTAHGAFPRGIFAQITMHANPEKLNDVDRESLLASCAKNFRQGASDRQFVLVNDRNRSGSKNTKDYDIYPKVARVEGSNFCHVGVDYDQDRQLIKMVSVTDNLVKGAAGSAIQNMNIRFGLPEGTGLYHYGL